MATRSTRDQGSRWIVRAAACALAVGVAGQAAADFNGDGRADIAVGIHYEAVNSMPHAGMVMAVEGGPGGITSVDELWHQDSGLQDSCEANDYFGSSLALGDFDGDGYDDLVVGVPNEELSGADNAGVVHVIYGTPSGLTTIADQLFSQDNATSGSSAEADDYFGLSLAAADFNGDGYRDLVVGTPREDWAAIADTGMVQVIPGSASGLDGSQGLSIAQSHLLNGANNAEDDQFGFALAAGDIDGDGYADLAIGTPGETLNGQIETGSVYVLYGAASGLSMDNDYFDQCTAGYTGGCDAFDHFGNALAMRPSAGPDGDGIFSDGFESGTTGAWSSSLP